MKNFLLRLGVFFLTITVGLLLLYHFFDQDDTSIGDARYSKTRKVFQEKNTYDALLIGSSRVININDVVVDGTRIFNYGFHAATPGEYSDYISFGFKNQPLKKVIVALDFYGTSKTGFNALADGLVIRPPAEYIEEVTTENRLTPFLTKFKFVRFKRLINRQIMETFNKPTGGDEWKKKYWEIYEKVYSNYEVDDELKEKYDRIKAASAKAELIVWTTPISKPLFELMQKKNLTAHYENFLRTSVASFGTVYNFMEINEFTSSPRNFIDENHTTTDQLFNIVKLLNSGQPQNQLASFSASVNDRMFTRLEASNIEDYILHKRYVAK